MEVSSVFSSPQGVSHGEASIRDLALDARSLGELTGIDDVPEGMFATKVRAIEERYLEKVRSLYEKKVDGRLKSRVKKLRASAEKEMGTALVEGYGRKVASQVAQRINTSVKGLERKSSRIDLERESSRIERYASLLFRRSWLGIFLRAIAWFSTHVFTLGGSLGRCALIARIVSIYDQVEEEMRQRAKVHIEVPSQEEMAPQMTPQMTLRQEATLSLYNDDPEAVLEARGRFFQCKTKNRGTALREDTVSLHRFLPAHSLEEAISQIESYGTQRVAGCRREEYLQKEETGEERGALVPLNEFFDRRVSLAKEGSIAEPREVKEEVITKEGVITLEMDHYFERLDGDGGHSSSDPCKTHLVNGVWQKFGKFFQVLRHAALSSRLEKTAEQQLKDSHQMALDLLAASLSIGLKNRKITVEGLSAFDERHPWEQKLLSVSLLTPDPFRWGMGNERRIWREQHEALKWLEAQKIEMNVGGKRVPVKCTAIAMNFGVNAGAFLGSGRQRGDNLRAWSEFRDLMAHAAHLAMQVDSTEKSYAAVQKQITTVLDLYEDIAWFVEKPRRYLAKGNRYELPAKMILLGQEIDALSLLLPKGKGEGKGEALQTAFNCMSGKDRTGMVGAILEVLVKMKEEGGEYPTHEQLEKEGPCQNRFVELLVERLSNYGGLRVTEWNTGVSGYKSMIMPYPKASAWKEKVEVTGLKVVKGKESEEPISMTRAQFFKQLTGFSSTVSS